MDETLLELLDKIKSTPLNESLSKDLIEQTISSFRSVAFSNGLNEDSYHSCIMNLLNCTRLTNHKFSTCLFLTMPNGGNVEVGTLSEILEAAGIWLESIKAINTIERVRVALQYLVGLIKYKIVPEEKFKIFYWRFYAFLKIKDIQDVAAQLIYYTTNHHNLTNWCVVCVKRTIEKAGRQATKHLKALLALFKRIRPEYVEVDVVSLKQEENAFPALSSTFIKTLEYTKNRLNKTNKPTLPHLETQQLALVSTAFPDLIRCGENFESHSTFDFHEFLRFFKTAEYLKSGTNYMSLLLHKFNFLLVSVMDVEDLVSLTYFLKRNFDTDKKLASNEIKNVLRGTNQLLEYLEEDTLNVTKSIRKFIQTLETSGWLLYINEILEILPKLQFKSFNKFFSTILQPIYYIFIVSHRNVKLLCQIVKSLSQFVYQQYLLISKCISTDDRNDYFSDEDMNLIADSLKHLTRILMNLEPSTFEVKYCVIQVYQDILRGRELVAINDLDIIPVVVARLLPITVNYVIVEMFAEILQNAFKVGEKRMVTENFFMFYLGKQMNELYSFLTENSCSSSYSTSSAESVTQISGEKNFFKLNHSVTFWPITHFDADKNWLAEPVLNAQTRSSLAQHCPNLFSILTNVKKSQMQRNVN